ncbi:MAG TPA: glycosyltransferase family 4 protein [Herpetosiphonaceae bacterium]|nr:glycosyltransferase family 4 protein [Herpetosiphonaceae bacterium]
MTDDQSRPHILIISHDVVGSRMAGPGIRYWEMAHTLAAQQPVTLIAPQPSDLQPSSFSLGRYAWGEQGSLAPWLADTALVVANGYVLHAHPELTAIAQPLALDLYDPILLENLELGRTVPLEERTASAWEDVLLLHRQLTAGDFFLCATERQRDLYMGALMAAGQITPRRVDADPGLRQLIDVVPFGCPASPPSREQPALRGMIEGIGGDDPILLWTGGLWDWLDPLTLIRAMPRLIEQHPTTRVVFLAGRHPGDAAAMRRPDEARALAADLGLRNTHVFFYEQWVPYERRADYLLDADIAVSLHHQHLETAYAAVRSRFLDHLWAGLPSVVSDGDASAELVRRHELGAVVPPNDPQALAAALSALIADPDERRACARRATALAATMSWQQCLAPLARWCRSNPPKEPRMNTLPASKATDEDRHPATPIDDTARNDALAALDQHWHVAEPAPVGGLLAPLRRFFIQQFVRPFVVPVIERQNMYNAAAVKALHALAESSDRRRSASQQQFEVHERHLQANERQIMALLSANDQTGEQLNAITGDVAALEQHILDLDDADTTLAELLLLRDADDALPGHT